MVTPSPALWTSRKRGMTLLVIRAPSVGAAPSLPLQTAGAAYAADGQRPPRSGGRGTHIERSGRASVAGGRLRGLPARADVELGEDRRHVVLDGPAGQHEPLRDLRVRQA